MPRRNRRRSRISTVPLEIRRCLFCNIEFMPNRSWQKYCSPEHSIAAHWQRKHGTAAPPADAAPNVIAKIQEFADLPDAMVREAEEIADQKQQIPVGVATPAARTLSKLGYGLPELDTKDEDEEKKK